MLVFFELPVQMLNLNQLCKLYKSVSPWLLQKRQFTITNHDMDRWGKKTCLNTLNEPISIILQYLYCILFSSLNIPYSFFTKFTLHQLHCIWYVHTHICPHRNPTIKKNLIFFFLNEILTRFFFFFSAHYLLFTLFYVHILFVIPCTSPLHILYTRTHPPAVYLYRTTISFQRCLCASVPLLCWCIFSHIEWIGRLYINYHFIFSTV